MTGNTEGTEHFHFETALYPVNSAEEALSDLRMLALKV